VSNGGLLWSSSWPFEFQGRRKIFSY
jgi:hypothetical protein